MNTTTNLADFGRRELGMAADLLAAYADNKNACPYFSDNGIQLMMNQSSGNVFLTDEECNVIMMNGDYLEGFYVSPYSGHEGFFDELISQYDSEDWGNEDREWLQQLAKDLSREDELPKDLKQAEAAE